MSSNPFAWLEECQHWWKDCGPEFKTYSRSDASRDNPVRQAQKCSHCNARRTIVVRYTDTASGEQK